MTYTISIEDFRRSIKILYDQSLFGCGNGGCRINKPTGMHTNASCKCSAKQIAKYMRMVADTLESHICEWDTSTNPKLPDTPKYQDWKPVNETATKGKFLIGDSGKFPNPKPRKGWDIWIENGEWFACKSVNPKKFNGHNYDNGDGTGRCICGCRMGDCSSSGPVDPFGACPKNPTFVFTNPFS